MPSEKERITNEFMNRLLAEGKPTPQPRKSYSADGNRWEGEAKTQTAARGQDGDSAKAD